VVKAINFHYPRHAFTSEGEMQNGNNNWHTWEVWALIGHCKGELGRTVEAIAAFQSAIDLIPDFAMPYYNLGVAYNQLGNLPKARKAYEKAVELQPDLTAAHFNLGLTCLQLLDRACISQELYILNLHDASLARRLIFFMHRYFR